MYSKKYNKYFVIIIWRKKYAGRLVSVGEIRINRMEIEIMVIDRDSYECTK